MENIFYQKSLQRSGTDVLEKKSEKKKTSTLRFKEIIIF